MPELVILDQLIDHGEDTDEEVRSFIRLTSSGDSQVAMGIFTPDEIVIDESFGRGIVTVKITVEDTIGTLVNIKPIEGDFEFKLYVGRSREDYRIYTLKLSQVRYDNYSIGASGDYRVNLILISTHWQEMNQLKRNRVFRDSRYSDVVKTIAEECGLNTDFIAPTKTVYDRIIQPNWTNIDMLHWMTFRSVSESDGSHFEFCVMNDEGFFFQPFSALRLASLDDLFRFDQFDDGRFILSGDANEDRARSRRKLMDFRVDQPYSDDMMSAGGVRYGYYDYMNKRYVRESVTISGSDFPQISDWTYVSESQENQGDFHYGFRDTATPDVMQGDMSRVASNMVTVTTSTNGICDVHPGQVIDIMIPVNTDFSDSKFNEYFSGKYIVRARRVVFDIAKQHATTIYRVCRHGMNGAETDGLVQTQRGKAL